MDLKIDNGYRLDVRRSRGGEHSFEAVNAVLDDFKQRARPVIQGLVHRRAAYLCARIIDHRTLELPVTIDGVVVPDDYTPMMGAMKILLDCYADTYDGTRRNAHYAFDAHVTVIPASGEALALLWTDQPALRTVWKETPQVHSFSYWDHDDRPLDVSEEEWALRGTVWADAAGDEVWAVTGMTTETIGRYGLPVPYIDAVLAYLPTLGERAILYAMDRVVTRHYRKQRPAAGDSLQHWLALDQAFKFVRGTRDGNAELQITREEIEKALPTISGSLLALDPTQPPEPPH